MSIGDFLGIQPSELKFPFELRKQSSCSLQLSNKTDNYIAFKVKTTNPKRYSVRPNVGIVSPHSLCNVTVTMQAPKETPLDMQCKDKFLFQSVIVPAGITSKDLINTLFDKEDGKIVEEFKLRVVYVPANRPPTVVEEDEEEEISPETSSAEDDIRNSSQRSLVSKLKQEKGVIEEVNRKLIVELELLQKQMERRRFSSSIWILVEILALLFVGIMVGYFINKYLMG